MLSSNAIEDKLRNLKPMLFTNSYGEGRVFVCVMGHVGYKSRQEGGLDEDAMLCTGFITVFQRGTEWAATGMVTQKIPGDFPSDNDIILRRQNQKLLK